MNIPSHAFRAAAVAFSFGFVASGLTAQTPVVRWAFDAAKGAPTTSTWISGGLLQIEENVSGYATFQSTGGVGPATPGVYNGAGNSYGDAAGSAQTTSAASPLLADAELAQFVVTMWIKPTVSSVEQPYARLLNISLPDSEKSNPGLFVALHNTNLEVGVNGGITAVTLPADSIRENAWTFVAFVYDGLARNPYYSEEMLAMVKAERNGAVLLGGIDNASKLAGSVGMNTGAPSFNISAGPLALNGLSVAVGCSNANRARAFRGLIDDIRIYSGLLATEQIEAVRRSALAGR